MKTLVLLWLAPNLLRRPPLLPLRRLRLDPLARAMARLRPLRRARVVDAGLRRYTHRVTLCVECKSRGKGVAAREESFWCEKCDPTGEPTRRYGYYLPAADEEHGDPVLSRAARHLWTFFQNGSGRDFDKHPPTRTDGVSIYTGDDGFEHIYLRNENVGRADVEVEDGHKVSVPKNPPDPWNTGLAPWPFHQHPELLGAGLVPPDWLTRK